MNKSKIPNGFSVLSLPKGWAVIKKQYEPLLTKEVIPFIGEFPFSPSDSESSGRTCKTTQIVGGRKGLYRFKLQDAELSTVVVRPCKRGGVLSGLLLKDIYWSAKRMIDELIISEMALNKGLAVPQIIGVLLQPKGLGFYKGFIIMREIYNSLNVSDYLKTVVAHDNARLFHRKKDLIETISNSLIQFHNCGFYHSDLNITNLVLQRDDAEKLKIWIIDLDKAKYYKELAFAKRINNLIRLNRSVIKLGLDKIITSSDRLRFLKSYLGTTGKNNQDFISRINLRCTANIRRHRLWWRITGKR